MEIYKLSDFGAGTKKLKDGSLGKDLARGGRRSLTGESKQDSPGGTDNVITDIKAAFKNQNRVNIFVGGEFAFSLDLSQLVDFKLKIGQRLTEEDLARYQTASLFGKLYQRTLEWLLTRPRSVKETRDYLKRKTAELSNAERRQMSEEIIARLLEKHYLDDHKFAAYYVENRFVKKGISKKRLELELMKKGINKAIIEEVLAEGVRDEKAEIQKIIQKKRGKYDDQKLIQYLCRQGFSYELSRTMVEENEF